MLGSSSGDQGAGADWEDSLPSWGSVSGNNVGVGCLVVITRRKWDGMRTFTHESVSWCVKLHVFRPAWPTQVLPYLTDADLTGVTAWLETLSGPIRLAFMYTTCDKGKISNIYLS